MVCRARDRYVIGGGCESQGGSFINYQLPAAPGSLRPASSPRAARPGGRPRRPSPHFPEEAAKAREGWAGQGSAPCPQPPHTPPGRTSRTLGPSGGGGARIRASPCPQPAPAPIACRMTLCPFFLLFKLLFNRLLVHSFRLSADPKPFNMALTPRVLKFRPKEPVSTFKQK